MGEKAFRVIFSSDADADLDELSDYWTTRGEAWRAEKYHRELIQHAEVALSSSGAGRRGRRCKSLRWRGAREILAFGVYRIIYRIDETAGIVNVLRLWHAHRHEPGSEL